MRYNIFFCKKFLAERKKWANYKAWKDAKNCQDSSWLAGCPWNHWNFSSTRKPLQHAIFFGFKNLLKFSAVRTEFLSAAIVHIFSSIKSDDKIIKKWPPKPPPLKHKPHQISSLVEAVKTSPFFSTAGNLKCQTATEDGGLEWLRAKLNLFRGMIFL